MKKIKISITFIVVFLCTESLFSQTSTTSDGRDPRPAYMRNIDEARARQAQRVEQIVEQSRSISTSPRKLETSEQRKAAELEKRKTLEEINRLLSAPPEFRVRYAEFLKGKNTGLVRVFPDRGCDEGLVVNVEELERCGEAVPVKGAGSLFSFRLNKLPDRVSVDLILYLFGQSDIHFIDGKFVVGTQSIQDIIADIGEVELADVTLRSESVKFLKSFKPAKSRAKVELQNQTLVGGISENGYFYSTSAAVRLNRTYVMRSIAFSNHQYNSFWNTDVLTAFRVVGQENDGSVVILWKELRESTAPYLKQ